MSESKVHNATLTRTSDATFDCSLPYDIRLVAFSLIHLRVAFKPFAAEEFRVECAPELRSWKVEPTVDGDGIRFYTIIMRAPKEYSWKAGTRMCSVSFLFRSKKVGRLVGNVAEETILAPMTPLTFDFRRVLEVPKGTVVHCDVKSGLRVHPYSLADGKLNCFFQVFTETEKMHLKLKEQVLIVSLLELSKETIIPFPLIQAKDAFYI